jgi:hypothetical protein
MKVTTKPVVRTFRLKCDPEEEAAVTIRQARTGDNIELNKLTENQSRVWREDENAIEMKTKWNPELMKRKRAYLTLVGTEGIVDEEGNPLFLFKEGKNGPELAMTEHRFNKAWDMLPTDVTDEISDYILVVNPQWDPRYVGE